MSLIFENLYEYNFDDIPIISSAIHDGHVIRENLLPFVELDDDTRLREEDPHTAGLAKIINHYVVAKRSRFEVDLNRPRDKAIYLTPEEAWGLKVWKETVPQEIINQSLSQYDFFYSFMKKIFEEMKEKYGSFIVLDIHSYNYRRTEDHREESADKNPEINIGTANVNREQWSHLINKFMDNLRSFDFEGRSLDVRENIKFKGGYFTKWVNENFPGVSCPLAIEFKKIFMDEWTGELYTDKMDKLKLALTSSIKGLLEEREKLFAVNG